ncbi:hypothetical protein SETIT_9G287400v2 [Setaria italica]|uniref:Proline-rich protein n=1 Tax=Setaria italica TaxID=4555 RepID=K4AEC3_SETIT|nr:proline-rich protein 4 [Setaria italica]RCV43350.1 hypothetical protein SETIT_9G287400v2 [Setaria italica]
MGSTPQRLLGVCAVLMAIAVANAASGEVASVVIGLAKCADCTRKNMKAEAAFKGLKVAIKCKEGNGEYTSKAVGELQSSGAFSVPVSVDLHGADCLAQLHSAAGTPCPGQEPSRITPLANGSFVAIPAGNMQVQQPSAVCASVTICGPIDPIIRRFFDHFHKKPVPPKPQPGPKPSTNSSSPAPSAGSPTPGIHNLFEHFHKKTVPPQPKLVPKPQPAGGAPSSNTTPSVSPTPIYHPPAKH